MARIRTIKPDFFTHPKIAACSVPARLLLASLFTQADDEGRLRDQPLLIRALAFGEDDAIDVKALLTELEAKHRILRYVVDDERFIAVRNFSEHQRISHPTASKLPPPEDDGALPAHHCESLASVPENFANRSGEIPPGREREQGKEREREGNARDALRGFTLREPDVLFATARGLNPTVEHERFVDYHLGEATDSADWSATWRAWCRKAVEFGRGHPPQKHVPRSARVAAQVEHEPPREPVTDEECEAIRARLAGPRYESAETAP